MRLKRGAIGNNIGEHIGNLMGTQWEFERNMLGTKENGKHPLLPPSPKLKEKNQGNLSAC